MSDTNLYNISPVDGRYANKLQPITEFFSEYALFKYRLEVEILWLNALSKDISITELPEFTSEEQQYLHNLINNFNLTEARFKFNSECGTSRIPDCHRTVTMFNCGINHITQFCFIFWGHYNHTGNNS